MGVVRAEGQARAQQVAGDVGAAVGAVLGGVVAQRRLDPARVEGLAVEHAAAGALVGGDVQVGVDPAAHGAGSVGAAERRAGGADLGLGRPCDRGAERDDRDCDQRGEQASDPEHDPRTLCPGGLA